MPPYKTPLLCNHWFIIIFIKEPDWCVFENSAFRVEIYLYICMCVCLCAPNCNGWLLGPFTVHFFAITPIQHSIVCTVIFCFCLFLVRCGNKSKKLHCLIFSKKLVICIVQEFHCCLLSAILHIIGFSAIYFIAYLSSSAECRYEQSNN